MHLAKHMQFHGVNYIVVPLELWEAARNRLDPEAAGDPENNRELYENMCAYDNSNEPAEIPNE